MGPLRKSAAVHTFAATQSSTAARPRHSAVSGNSQTTER